MSRFASFREFYPFYLSEHRHPVSRRLHFIGSCGVLLLVAAAILRGQAILVLAALFCGYGFAWVGHFFFEKNRPATFQHPLYSFMGDWVMFADILRRRVPLVAAALGAALTRYAGAWTSSIRKARCSRPCSLPWYWPLWPS